ncbi:S-methyl-5-thioribose-1-phosphate isomerase [Desulforhopalus sp. 52FAK]
MKINNIPHRTIWPNPENQAEVCIIDQRILPHKISIETLVTKEQATAAIKDMLVRGAGLIGATAGFGMYLASLSAPDDSIAFDNYIQGYAIDLNNSRPTARNLKWAIDRVIKSMEKGASVEDKRKIAFTTACEIADEDADYCRRIGEHGMELIKEISKRKNGKPVNILTHCNAGWLAFVDYGSATAPIYAARDAGIPVHVWVDETRPWNQGARLTAWELQQEGIDNTLICDNTGGHLMQHGMVDIVIVGSDRTTHTGDVANKIGTYLKAVAAKDNNIPFYVALPSSTIDWELDKGHDIPIEQREEDEITTVMGLSDSGEIISVQLSAPGTKAANYGFDVTPSRLVTGLITERGVVAAEKKEIHSLFPEGSS